MEQINKNFEIGGVYFSNISNLSGVKIVEIPDGTFEIASCGDNVDACIKKYHKAEDFYLIMVKYLGNGIFEELITGTKLITDEAKLGFTVVKEDGTKGGHFMRKLAEKPNWMTLRYEDYVKNNDGEKTLSKEEYLEILKGRMQRNVEYPILIDSTYGWFDVNSEIFNIFLNQRNNETFRIIKDIKKMALIDAKEANKMISIVVDHMEKEKKK